MELTIWKLWRRYMDDAFVVRKEGYKKTFPQHINSIDPCIKCTVEGTRPDGSMSFLDTLVMPEPDRTLSIKVSRKPTHTVQ